MSGPATLALGDTHAGAIMPGGGVFTWGANASGQLGDGSTSSSSTPKAVAGLVAIVDLSAGQGGHTCAIDEHGVLSCWGDNVHGQLGDGSTESKSVPTPVDWK